MVNILKFVMDFLNDKMVNLEKKVFANFQQTTQFTS